MLNKVIKVSLGIPVYNESLFLKDTIESLLSQSYSNIEVVELAQKISNNIFKIKIKQNPRLKLENVTRKVEDLT